MYKIDKNIPAPIVKKYPFGEMSVNDSFFVPFDKKLVKEQHKGIMTAAYRFSNRNKNGRWKFVAKKVKNGTRVWRIK